MNYPETKRPTAEGWYFIRELWQGQSKNGWIAVEVFDSRGMRWRMGSASNEIDGTVSFYGPLPTPGKVN